MNLFFYCAVGATIGITIAAYALDLSLAEAISGWIYYVSGVAAGLWLRSLYA